MSALAIERVAAEWRERLATAERAAEERATMAVAQAKQTAHEQMEAKDAQVQALMQQKRASEICGMLGVVDIWSGECTRARTHMSHTHLISF
jgi:hypothetical protein